jgi:hypothetical protein
VTTPVTPAPATQTPVEKLLFILQSEPALITTLAGSAAALIGAFVVNVGQTQEAAIVTIASALIALITASLAKPVKYSVITGAVVTGLTAAAAFGLKLSPEILGMVATGLGYLLPGIVARLHLTPNILLRGRPA